MCKTGIVYCATRENKCLSRIAHDFLSTWGPKNRFFFLQGSIKCLYDPLVENSISCNYEKKWFYVCEVWCPSRGRSTINTSKINVSPMLHMVFFHMGVRIVYCATREKKFILREWGFTPVQNEANNHTSKINVFPVSHSIFFLQGVQKWIFFAPQRSIKCSLCASAAESRFSVTAESKAMLYIPLQRNTM